MLKKSVTALVAAAGGVTATAQGYSPGFKPDTRKAPIVGAPNEVMVLGSAHLSGLPRFSPDLLEPLLGRLAAWKPGAIATEDLSGLQCDALRRSPRRYADTVNSYCPDPTEAGRSIGLDVPAANAAAEELLATWPAEPTGAHRRRLGALVLAAGEPNSAVVQWLRLPPADRRAGDGLTAGMIADIERRRLRPNESTQIAAVLAARLGHERVWSVDDHSADLPTPAAEEEAYEAAIKQAWDNPVLKERMAWLKPFEAGFSRPGGVLALYRAYNTVRAQDYAYRSDFGAALGESSPRGYGRQYAGWWETRNLRMVANIREVLARRPGTRLLAIVGASHKGYYEAYLNQMHDVRLVGTGVALD